MAHVEKQAMLAEAEAFRGGSRFEVVGQIGQGASGAVYEVVGRESSSRVALKTLRNPNAEALLLLKNEFRTAQDLSHPNLVTPKELFGRARVACPRSGEGGGKGGGKGGGQRGSRHGGAR